METPQPTEQAPTGLTCIIFVEHPAGCMLTQRGRGPTTLKVAPFGVMLGTFGVVERGAPHTSVAV